MKKRVVFVLVPVMLAIVILLAVLIWQNNRHKSDITENKNAYSDTTNAIPGQENSMGVVDTRESDTSEAPPVTAIKNNNSNDELKILRVEMNKHTEENFTITGDELLAYYGYLYLSFHMNDSVRIENLENYVYINGQPVSLSHMYVSEQQTNVVNVFLSDDLPENISVSVKAGIFNGRLTLKEDKALSLIHYPAITCDIRQMDAITGELLPKAMYIAGNNHDFLLHFSEPMNKESLNDSLSVTGDINDVSYTMELLTDKKLKLSVKESGEGKYTLSIRGAKGTKDIYGNTFSLDYYSFSVIPPQKLFSVKTQTGEIEILHTFFQGMRPWSFSPLKTHIMFGILEDEPHDPVYTKSSYSLDTRILSPLADQFLPLAGELSLIHDEDSFLHAAIMNPLIQRDEWTKDGRCIYQYDNMILLMDLKNIKLSLLYTEQNDKRRICAIFCLDNGGYAVIEYENGFTESEQMILVTIDQQGRKTGEYPLPFKIRYGEGWIHYYCNVVDMGDGKLLLDGYEGISDQWLMRYYSIDLSTGELSVLYTTETPMAFFPDKSIGFYRHYIPETGDFIMEAKNTNGDVLFFLDEKQQQYIRYIAYHDILEKYFIIRNWQSGRMEVHTLHPETYKLETFVIPLERNADFIGFGKNGELLMLDCMY